MIFGGGTATVILFILKPNILQAFWEVFWLARWADLVVYLAIIFLWYWYIEVINSLTRRDEERTNLARAVAIQNATWFVEWANIIFIIPSYWENSTVLKTIDWVIHSNHKIILIDDWNNSVDFRKWLKWEILSWKVVLIEHPINLWQWAALQTWANWVLRYAPETEYIVHFDADWQHLIQDVEKFIEAFVQDPELDIVFGSRFLWSTTGMEKIRHYHKKLQIIFMRMFVWLRLTDTNNGFRMIKTSALKKLIITSNRMAHASEIENLVRDSNLNYSEVPVTIVYTEYSKEKWQSLNNAFSITKELFYKRWFYK